MASGPPAPGFSGKLSVIFMGTPPLAAHILGRLLDADDAPACVVAVVTRPDQPKGRGLKLNPSEVAQLAAARGLPVLKPVKIRTAEFLGELKSYRPDLLVVAAYGRILPASILAAAMPINVHASLLPRHRGAAPIQGALLAGDKIGGVTIMRMVEAMDAGPILLQRQMPIASDETQMTLTPKLAELGAQALLDAVAQIARGAIHETPQDESQATYTAMVKKADGRIDWSIAAELIERMVRAYDPWPVAFTHYKGEELRIYRAVATADPSAGATAIPGTIVQVKGSLTVQCGSGRLSLLEVQAAGRKRMKAEDFARGRRLEIGARMDSAA